MEMQFVPILHKHYRSKTNFYVFIYDKTGLKFCESFRIFLAVFMEKFQIFHYLNYVRRGIGHKYILYTIKDLMRLTPDHKDCQILVDRGTSLWSTNTW